jgi:putative peptidoglycan lipid II flippase
MYVALLSLFLNAFLNYLFAFKLGYGHVGIAVGSSIAAVISVLILEIILIKDGFIKINNPFNRFNLSILISSIFVLVFLNFSSALYDFYNLNQFEKIFALFFKVTISMVIYFGMCRLIRGNPLKEVLN